MIGRGSAPLPSGPFEDGRDDDAAEAVAHQVNLGVGRLLKGADELMHAALAHGARAVLHRPERELPQAAQDAAADRPERTERLHRHGIGVERRLRIEGLTVLIGRSRTSLAGAEADGEREIPIRRAARVRELQTRRGPSRARRRSPSAARGPPRCRRSSRRLLEELTERLSACGGEAS